MIDFQRINGYSNIFWGGGGEDDQFYNRIRAENLTVTKQFDGQSPSMSRYKTQFLKSSLVEKNIDPRLAVIREGRTRHFKTDGLVDLRYQRINLQFKPLYTHILVDIQQHNVSL